MCAQYQIKEKIKNLERIFGITVEDVVDWTDLVLPSRLGPVVTEGKIKLMRYSLIPSWSKDPKVKFATHNARIETVANKPTWKKPFLKNHCIVPISNFIEPIYEGKLAGNMVNFNGQDLLMAAGIFDTWVNKETGEIVESYAIITSEPCPFVKEAGHDRQPIFLSKEAALKWMTLEGDAQTLLHFLNQNAIVPSLTTSVNRPLKPGWEKRKQA